MHERPEKIARLRYGYKELGMETGRKGIEVIMCVPLVENFRRPWWVRGSLGFYCIMVEIPGLDAIIKAENQ